MKVIAHNLSFSFIYSINVYEYYFNLINTTYYYSSFHLLFSFSFISSYCQAQARSYTRTSVGSKKKREVDVRRSGGPSGPMITDNTIAKAKYYSELNDDSSIYLLGQPDIHTGESCLPNGQAVTTWPKGHGGCQTGQPHRVGQPS